MSSYKYVETETVKYLEASNKQNLDLFLCYCGSEACLPGQGFGPAVRFQYLLHFILDGEGTYEANGNVYHLKKNQGFLITPDTVTYYEADKQNPWHYIWIGFNGVKAATYLEQANLNEDQLVFQFEDGSDIQDYVFKMLELNSSSISNELERQGLLYLFMSKLTSQQNNQQSHTGYKATESYLEKAIAFIQNNYTNTIKITDVANYIGVNRSYLTHLFKQKLDMSPQEFLVSYRIDKACHLLQYTNLAISDISRSVGYSDPLAFSRIFKKVKSVSPKHFRQTQHLNTHPHETL
ncbi:MAG TPA: AraC family transcriptional regulator [Firmicutes bacterium]|nr:AraC family transcriptional regulator [Bacillota bacterium]